MWTFDVMDDRGKDGKRTMITTYTRDGKRFSYTDRCFNTVNGKKEFMESAKKERIRWLAMPEPVVEVVPEPVVEEPVPVKKTRKRRSSKQGAL